MLYARLPIYHSIFLCIERSQKSASSHGIKREIAIDNWIFYEYGSYHLCINGASQLFAFCHFFWCSGCGIAILCCFILSRRFCRHEVSFITNYIFGDEVFWAVMYVDTVSLKLESESENWWEYWNWCSG